MRVVQLGLFLDPAGRPPDVLLEQWHGLTEIASAAACAGAEVTVIQASRNPGRMQRSGVDYAFVAPEGRNRRMTQSAGFHRIVDAFVPDVVHIHGLAFSREIIDVAERFGELPIILQDHADRPPRLWRRRLWRRAALSVSGISFCARAQAEPFVRAGLLRPDIPIFEIPESSSRFTCGDQAAARAQTGVYGEPAILAVAHLNDNKDPLTVLEGVSAAVQRLPRLQLWWCFASAPRLAAVESRIAGDARLRDRVHLLGRVPHDQVERLMRAADLFVLGSHREGGNFSLIEALATGLTPVVTDIPSNRSLTGDGVIGALWRTGDSLGLARALITLGSKPAGELRAKALAHYREHLSLEAIGRALVRAYAQLTNPGTREKQLQPAIAAEREIER